MSDRVELAKGDTKVVEPGERWVKGRDPIPTGVEFSHRGSAADVWLHHASKDSPCADVPGVHKTIVKKVMRVVTSYFNNTEAEQGEEILSELRREFNEKYEQWRSLRHPNTIEIYAIKRNDFTLYQEYCAYGDLRQYAKQGLAEHRLNRIITDVLSGIDYLHSLDPPVVHGGINPGKIYIAADFTAKIGEFGISSMAVHFPHLVPCVSLTGIARWMSPEALRNELETDAATLTTQSDMWSFGCTIAEVITGRLPYHRCRYDAQVVKKVLKGEPPSGLDQTLSLSETIGGLAAPARVPNLWSILEKCWLPVTQRPSASDLIKEFKAEYLQARIRTIPLPTPTFTGRLEEIQSLGNCLVGGFDERRVCVLYGLGGVGKTQVAVKTIEKYQDNWTHILYVDATSKATIESMLQEFAKSQNIGAAYGDTLDWLQSRGEPWLLVYDNADDPFVDVQNYFPGGNNGRILIITCLRDMKTRVKGPSFDCPIPQMSREDALALFVRLARIQDQVVSVSETESMDALLEDTGHLTSAIIYAGIFIGHSGVSMSVYRNLLSERRRFMPGRHGKLELKLDRRYLTAFMTWQLCYGLLTKNSISQQLLWLLAFLHPNHITEDIFKRAVTNVNDPGRKPIVPSTEIESTARTHLQKLLSMFLDQAGLWDTSLFFHAIKELAGYSLVEFNQMDKTCSIHILAQEYTRLAIPQSADLALECATTLLAYAVDWSNSAEGRASRAALEIHVTSVLSQQPKKVSANHVRSFAMVYEAKGQWERKNELEEYARVATEITLAGGRNPNTLRNMSKSACTSRDQGQWGEAEETESKVLDASRRLLGEWHLDTLASMSNLGLTYWKQGRWDEAEVLGTKVLEARTKLRGEDHPDTLTSMNNLASIYRDQGRWEEAEAFDVKALDSRRRRLGEAHPETLMSMNNLASTYWSQGRWAEAENLDVKVLEAHNQRLGGKHPYTLLSMSTLASTYWKQGRWGEAEWLNVKVMNAQRQTLGEEHPDTLTTMNNLASTYRNQGRWSEAEILELKVLDVRRRRLGERHPGTMRSMSNLGLTYMKQGRWDDAEQMESKALAIRKRFLGDKHPDTLTSKSNLASIYRSRRRWDEAEEIGVDLLDARRQILGGEHPDTITSMSDLASTYLNQGRWDEAEKLDTEVLDMRRRLLGVEHPDTLSSMSNLASTFWIQGRWERVEALELKVLEARTRLLGQEHPDTLTSMSDLASTLHGRGRLDEAERLLTQVVETRTRTIGNQHPDTIEARDNLSVVQSERMICKCRNGSPGRIYLPIPPIPRT